MHRHPLHNNPEHRLQNLHLIPLFVQAETNTGLTVTIQFVFEGKQLLEIRSFLEIQNTQEIKENAF